MDQEETMCVTMSLTLGQNIKGAYQDFKISKFKFCISKALKSLNFDISPLNV